VTSAPPITRAPGPPGEILPEFAGAVRPDRARWVDSSGVRLAVYEWGEPDGRPILAVHGGFDFAGTFDLLASLLAEHGWRFVAFDARGHGDSEHAALYSWGADLRDALAVLDTLGPEPVVVLGHSKGGGVVLELADALPYRLSHLINFDGLPSKNSAPDLTDHERRRWRKAEIEGWLDHRATADTVVRKPDTLDGLARRRHKLNPRLPFDWIRYLVTIGGRHDEDGWRWKIDPALRPGGFGPWRPEWSMERLPGIGVPVLGVLGLELEQMSWFTRPADVVPNLPPGAQFVPLEGVGHFLHIEQPRLVADLVLDFLGTP